MLKAVLITPPQWLPTAPQLAVPLLVGQLRAAGVDASGLDLSIDFFNHILNSEYIKKTLDDISLIEKNNGGDEKERKKRKAIKDWKSKNQKYLELVPEKIDEAVKIMRTEDFYDPKKFLQAKRVMFKALELISLPYYPAEILFYNYNNSDCGFTIKDLNYYTIDKRTNMFIDYYKSIVEEIINNGTDLIGISIAGWSQVIPGLTLARMIKDKTNIKVLIGGNYFGRVLDVLKEQPEFFKTYCDVLAIGEGEKSIVEIAKYVGGEIPIEDVSSIAYFNGEEVLVNPKGEPKKLNEIANISLEGIDLSKYIIPNVMLPIQTNKGCYWGKCSFCALDYGNTYSTKSITQLVDELSELKEKHGIIYFDFVDESISPSYLANLSEELLNRKLGIYYTCCARHENGFTKELLEKAKLSGLLMMKWGYEAGSERVLKLMNKGVDANNRLNIMRDSTSAKIWNHAFFMFGFPGETVKEAKKTKKDINNNLDVIHSKGYTTFQLVSDKIIANSERLGISNIRKPKEELSDEYMFDAVGITTLEADKIRYSQIDIDRELLNIYFHTHLYSFCYTSHYLSRYGFDWVKNHRVRLKKDTIFSKIIQKIKSLI